MKTGEPDWDKVERLAEEAYFSDSVVIDKNDFVAGYKLGWIGCLRDERIWSGPEATE